MKAAMEDDVCECLEYADGSMHLCEVCGPMHKDMAARLARLRDAAKVAYAHVAELREAWRTGAIHDTDGRGGERSNRNVDVEVALRAAIAESEGP